ncbi:MAG: monovalent cation/H(+) antiporter subunit G [Pseudomonadota bacterium]
MYEIIVDIWSVSRFYIGGALCLIGALLTLVGTIGVLRFPDFYTRLHAASVTDTAGATFLLVGMAFLAPHWLVVTKLVAIWIFIFLTSPTASHAIANAAHVAGLEPMIGRQKGDDGATGGEG